MKCERILSNHATGQLIEVWSPSSIITSITHSHSVHYHWCHVFLNQGWSHNISSHFLNMLILFRELFGQNWGNFLQFSIKFGVRYQIEFVPITQDLHKPEYYFGCYSFRIFYFDNVLLTKIVLFSKNHGQKQSYKHKHPQAMYDVIGRLSMASQIYLCVNFYDNKTELLFTYDIF